VRKKTEFSPGENGFSRSEAGSEAPTENVKDYFERMDEIAKALSKRLDGLEEENLLLKQDNERLKTELEKRTGECLEIKNQFDAMSEEHTRVLDKLKEAEGLYVKEQKRANLLEIENNRSMDELRSLRKEKNELMMKIDRNRTSIIDKIKDMIKKDEK
jgi:chromosome segregation ATPase